MSDYEESVGDDDTVSVNEEELNESPFIASKKPLMPKKTIVPTIDNYNDEDEDDEDDDIADDDEDDDENEIIDDDEQDYDALPNDGFKKGGASAKGDESDYDEQLDHDDADAENAENVNETKMTKGSVNKKSAQDNDETNVNVDEESDEDDDENYNENYLQKFDSEIAKNYVNEYHPECYHHNYDEISKSSIVLRNEHNIIIDPLHKTIPFLTKYEKARVLGQRAKQIEYGSKPYVQVPENVIEPHIIAELELKNKKLPFIIKRPLPNGSCEYWKLSDLEMIAF